LSFLIAIEIFHSKSPLNRSFLEKKGGHICYFVIASAVARANCWHDLLAHVFVVCIIVESCLGEDVIAM
jgi:hypothetical protein